MSPVKRWHFPPGKLSLTRVTGGGNGPVYYQGAIGTTKDSSLEFTIGIRRGDWHAPSKLSWDPVVQLGTVGRCATDKRRYCGWNYLHSDKPQPHRAPGGHAHLGLFGDQ